MGRCTFENMELEEKGKKEMFGLCHIPFLILPDVIAESRAIHMTGVLPCYIKTRKWKHKIEKGIQVSRIRCTSENDKGDLLPTSGEN